MAVNNKTPMVHMPQNETIWGIVVLGGIKKGIVLGYVKDSSVGRKLKAGDEFHDTTQGDGTTYFKVSAVHSKVSKKKIDGILGRNSYGKDIKWFMGTNQCKLVAQNVITVHLHTYDDVSEEEEEEETEDDIQLRQPKFCTCCQDATIATHKFSDCTAISLGVRALQDLEEKLDWEAIKEKALIKDETFHLVDLFGENEVLDHMCPQCRQKIIEKMDADTIEALLLEQ